MKLNRLEYNPGALLEFYEEGLQSLGALCERTWHDRLEVIAEGRAAAIWNAEGVHEAQLHFVPPDVTAAHDAEQEVFPGSPLTFQLAEALRNKPLTLERFVLPAEAERSRPPESTVAEKLWRAQFPETRRWQLMTPFKADYHFSLLGLVRCEIQAIDQHWSLHRVAVSLPDGEPDDHLAGQISYSSGAEMESAGIRWPVTEPPLWRNLLNRAIQKELEGELSGILARQQNSFRKEIERIDEYFASYAQELNARAGRSGAQNVKAKMAERLAAAEGEHGRRRADQIARHEIRVHPHLDFLMLIAERAWSGEVQFQREHQTEKVGAQFIPRSRRWKSGPRESRQ